MRACQVFHLSPSHARDCNNNPQDGKIEEQELINYLTKVQVEKTNDSLDTVKDLAREIFERADRDGNGVLSKRELKRVLHEDDDLRDELRAAHGRHWKDFWTELDANGVRYSTCWWCCWWCC